MKTGEFIHRFAAKDGREVILRTPKWEDLDDLMEHLNSLIEEGADIPKDRKITREEEADRLARAFATAEKGDFFIIVAEIRGKVVGTSDITILGTYRRHIGELGIGLRREYRDKGIGTEILGTMIEQAAKMGLKMLTLNVFATNSRARHVYEKVGFRETGRTPNYFYKNGEYIDDITMVKEI